MTEAYFRISRSRSLIRDSLTEIGLTNEVPLHRFGVTPHADRSDAIAQRERSAGPLPLKRRNGRTQKKLMAWLSHF